MQEFLEAVQAALADRAGAGDLLADVTAARVYLLRADNYTDLPCLVVAPIAKRRLGGGQAYQYAEVQAAVQVYAEWSAGSLRADAQSAMELATKVERSLAENPTLASNPDFSGGAIRIDESAMQMEVRFYTAVLPADGSAPQDTALAEVIITARVGYDDGAVGG